MSQQLPPDSNQHFDIKDTFVQNSQIGQAGGDLNQYSLVLNLITTVEKIASEPALPRDLVNRLLEGTNLFVERLNLLEQAEVWLSDESFRQRLALDIANTALKGKVLSPCSAEEEREAKVDFTINLHECLGWLLEAFQTGIAKELKYEFKQQLNKYPLELYIHALRTLKRKAQKDLSRNKSAVNVIDEYTEMLIAKISED